MSVAKWFQDKWGNRVRQFGLRASLRQAMRAAVRPVWRVNRDIVVAIPDHHPSRHPQHPDVHAMTAESVESAAGRGELTEQQRTLLLGFLAEGCRGFLAEIDGRLAGYGFVQPGGVYLFGFSRRFRIPEGMMVLKNLLVFPGFRGRSLGKKLNQARLAAIPEGYVPLVFVIVENRYAIRNLKMFGFEEMLIVSRTTWFKKWTRQRIEVMNDCDITRRVIQGLTITEPDEGAGK